MKTYTCKKYILSSNKISTNKNNSETSLFPRLVYCQFLKINNVAKSMENRNWFKASERA